MMQAVDNGIELLNDFDEFYSRALASLSENYYLSQQIRELKEELDIAMRDITSMQDQLYRRDLEISEKSREILSLYRERTQAIIDLGKSSSIQDECIKLKYELEVLATSRRTLERDVELHKAENERLQRIIQQHERENLQIESPAVRRMTEYTSNNYNNVAYTNMHVAFPNAIHKKQNSSPRKNFTSRPSLAIQTLAPNRK